MILSPVFAQDIIVKKPSQVTFTNLGSLLGGAVGAAIVIALMLAFLYLIMGGIQWITSGGDKAKTEEARDRITTALVGLAIVAAAWAIMRLVGFFFGIDPFALNIPTVAE
ncbi:MAG: hypothetical protein A2784_01960 [Candidatus Chisholmbacteria bacterium RIFCSPHIGHO2_01_FULL_48_12]|uniref:Uncharacterized protein n=1 Tax=Candidatus Chisholmbacteria bacterium RIFCSPHIGHO2_01_FULL_48_12 TaxID=1797589 RepID=A0A1G1VQ16_9BACT|nr:MAG: hypothetical protein A2784_01960 [Candidatus Chisholmbacteria bacterium RIFCSPHIGHO2_01_FULL_48_12]